MKVSFFDVVFVYVFFGLFILISVVLPDEILAQWICIFSEWVFVAKSIYNWYKKDD